MTAPDDALAAIEAHGVQSADDALAMADAILDPENDGVEWLMQHGCDVMDHLRAEVRSLRAHIAGEPDRVAAAVAAEREAERDWRRSRHMIAEHINAAAVERTERLSVERYAAWAALDALLRGAPCGYVPVPVVQRCLDAVDEWERERSAPVARTVARAAMVAARTALDAALAAATTTPKESP